MYKRKLSNFISPRPKPDLALGRCDSLASAWSRRHAPSSDPNPAVASRETSVEVVEDVELSQKQKQFFDLIAQRESVFITGAAGTGKSYVLKILQDVMSRLHKADTIFITASTGVAACNIGGLTIHSWAGVGTGNESVEELCSRVNRSRDAKRNWKKAEILVIDEISILSSDLFDKLSKIGSRIRGNDAPFGGLQLICCGDFFQLPPVGLNDRNNRFCFESDIWKRIFTEKNVIILDQVFRQKETNFLNILHELRRGELSVQSRLKLEAKARAYTEESNSKASVDDHIRPTVLYSTNKDVDQINESEITKLNSPVVEFLATDEGQNTQQLKNLKAPAALKLKIGAQVMLLKNLDTAKGLVNGARGVVVEFCKPPIGTKSIFPRLPKVRFEVLVGDLKTSETRLLIEEVFDVGSGSSVATRWQLPLMLAYAISIHKSQGMTIAKLDVSFKGIFEVGQAYVALSRATNWSGLQIKYFEPGCIRAHHKVKEFYSNYGYEAERTNEGSDTVSTTVSQLVSSFNEALDLTKASNRKAATATSAQGAASGVLNGSVTNETDNWLVSKRMKSENAVDTRVDTAVDVFSEFACDGADDWMERSYSLASTRPKGTVGAVSDTSVSVPLKCDVKWHAPVNHEFDMFAGRPDDKHESEQNTWPKQSTGMSVPHWEQHQNSHSNSFHGARNDRPVSATSYQPGKVKWGSGKSAASAQEASKLMTSVKSCSVLDEDQKRRIEQNRQKALLLLAQNRMKSCEEGERFLADL